MNESPEEWLRRLFQYETCPECGGDAEDHEVSTVLDNYFAWCRRSPFADTTEESMTSTPSDENSQ
jgi:hypothetical protein